MTKIHVQLNFYFDRFRLLVPTLINVKSLKLVLVVCYVLILPKRQLYFIVSWIGSPLIQIMVNRLIGTRRYRLNQCWSLVYWIAKDQLQSNLHQTYKYSFKKNQSVSRWLFTSFGFGNDLLIKNFFHCLQFYVLGLLHHHPYLFSP